MRARRFDLGVQLHGGGGNANPLLLRFGARVTAGSRAPGRPRWTGRCRGRRSSTT